MVKHCSQHSLGRTARAYWARSTEESAKAMACSSVDSSSGGEVGWIVEEYEEVEEEEVEEEEG